MAEVKAMKNEPYMSESEVNSLRELRESMKVKMEALNNLKWSCR